MRKSLLGTNLLRCQGKYQGSSTKERNYDVVSDQRAAVMILIFLKMKKSDICTIMHTSGLQRP
uniref:Splicing factor 45 n=1 Tax=Arundo donax TaxID=35708 RepID=A0A0A9DN34_ARUDO